LQKKLYLGNLNARRDWGHAKDYVEAQWLMLQKNKPDDFVIATGIQHSVRDFINLASKNLDMKIDWRGKDLDEVGSFNGDDIIKIDPKYFRPTEVETLLGDASKARNVLNWNPKISFETLVKEMIEKDLKLAKKEAATLDRWPKLS
jgi:GDPmannose 4,6-dehydratase